MNTNYFEILVSLMNKDMVSPADHKRIGRLARIVAQETGKTIEEVLEAAR